MSHLDTTETHKNAFQLSQCHRGVKNKISQIILKPWCEEQAGLKHSALTDVGTWVIHVSYSFVGRCQKNKNGSTVCAKIYVTAQHVGHKQESYTNT